MKTLAFAALAAAILTAGAASAQTLNLKIEGLEPRGGSVMVAVQSRDQYLLPAMSGGAVLDGTSTRGEAILSMPLPAGEYAVTVLHDEDSNYDMTLNADGKPAEGWATLNQARLRAKPSFDEVKFVIAGDTDLVLPVVYPAK